MDRKREWIWRAVLVIGVSAASILGGCAPAATPTPTLELEEIGYANPELLVETDWLAGHLDDTDVRIVDARDAEEYQAGHIPGAVSIPRPTTFDPEASKGIIGQSEQVAALFGSQGIDETAHVVVYDEGKGTAAARVFWTLEYYGHPRVSVLNGGFTKWQAEAREVTVEEPEIAPVTFTVSPDPTILSTREQILEDIGQADVLMLDARSPEEYRGEDLRAKRGGHIAGAVNIDWVENFTVGDVPVFKSAAELARLYEAAGVTQDKLIHAY